MLKNFKIFESLKLNKTQNGNERSTKAQDGANAWVHMSIINSNPDPRANGIPKSIVTNLKTLNK